MDRLSESRRSANMRVIRSRDTRPEIAVRQMVHALGYRFRLHRKDLPGKPDLVFPGLGKVIFVHGCFWHQHSSCREGRLPGSRVDYWGPKLARNQERDREHLANLNQMGWHSLVIWECETEDKPKLTQRLGAFLGSYAKSKRAQA